MRNVRLSTWTGKIPVLATPDTAIGNIAPSDANVVRSVVLACLFLTFLDVLMQRQSDRRAWYNVRKEKRPVRGHGNVSRELPGILLSGGFAAKAAQHVGAAIRLRAFWSRGRSVLILGRRPLRNDNGFGSAIRRAN